MAAAKAARRNTFTNKLHLPNDPFQDPRIGRRTGVPLNIKARKDSHGFDNIDDYFPDSDPEEENVVPTTQSSAKDCIVGRRTGVPLSIIARKDSHGFDNIDDYFPESDPEEQNVVANGKSSAQDTHIGRKAVNINPTKDAEVFDKVDDELVNSGATKSKELSPGEAEPAGTPEENDESPNDTGTAVKNPASREPTPQLKGLIKKRLSFTNAKPLNESEKTQADCRDSQSQKNTDPTSEEIVENEIEIDVVDLSNDSNLIVEESANSSSLDAKSKEKDTKQQQLAHERNTKNRVGEDDKQQRGQKRNTKNRIDENGKQQKQQRGSERNTKNRVDEDDEVIDVEEIEEEETFLTIGNNTIQIAKGSAALGKSPVSSFIMSESFVLEGTRHKSISPEFGTSSDSQTEPDARAKKSRIPVRQKRLMNTKPAQQRATRGRRKKAVEEAQVVDTEEAEADQKEDDKQNNRKKQILSARGRKEAAGKGKPSESEAVEVQNGGTDENEERRGTRLLGKRRKSKSTGRGERKVTVSDEGVEGDEKSAVDIEHGKKNAKGRKNTQKQNRITRGRKQKNDTENMDDGAAEVINVDSDGKKLSDHRTRPNEGDEDENRAEQNGSAADRSEQSGECKTTDVSGRKTRAQRKKEKEIKDKKGEGKDIEVVVDDLEIEEVESENLGSLDMEKEIEKSERESRAKRKEKAKKNQENDGVGNEQNLTQAYGKRGSRKSQSFGRDTTLGEGDGQDLTEKVEDVSKVRGGVRGEGREHDAEHEEKRDALDTIDDLADGQASSSEHVSVTNITNVSSIASSGSESSKKVISGTRPKRRKRSRILPPYATKRLPSKGNNSKSSSTINSHDSMSETDAKKRRLQVEGNQTSREEKSSTRKGAATNPRISGRAKRFGRTSEGATKSVVQSHEKESGTTVENTISVAADEVGVADSVQEATGVADCSFESVLVHQTDTTTPAQPVTALKSILKSGGSLGRAATVSRKRGKTPDKSNSGGSDADDESVLPAKQPNRKRLSTVSFASTPHVQESSSVPANRSSAGLSFVSKCNSYQSTDGTFTPGSVRSVRSSVSSAGSSSAGESAIDPEEEITITNDARQPQDTPDEQNTRRSKRTIVPPLQYWKNERIDYERRKSGGWCIKGIIKNPTPTPKHRRKSRQTKKPVVRTENNENAVDFSEEEFNNDLEGFEEVTNPKGMVLHAENNEEVEMDIFHTPAMLNFTNPSGKPAQDDDPLIVHKFISQPLFGGGQVILRPEAEKGRQVVRNDTMVFYVIKGTVMVTVHQCSAVLHTGSTFFVPQGNSYNIKNLKKTDAKLMFVQIKG